MRCWIKLALLVAQACRRILPRGYEETVLVPVHTLGRAPGTVSRRTVRLCSGALVEREPEIAAMVPTPSEAVLISMLVLVRAPPQIEPKAFSRQYCGTY